MATLDLPATVQYLTDSEGRRTAVLLDIRAWESIVDWIENATDTQLALKALKELTAGGARRRPAGRPGTKSKRTGGEPAPRPSGSRVLALPPTIPLEILEVREVRRVRLEGWRVVYAVAEISRQVAVLLIARRPPYRYEDLEDLLKELPE